jgi:hypothetical protein
MPTGKGALKQNGKPAPPAIAGQGLIFSETWVVPRSMLTATSSLEEVAVFVSPAQPTSQTAKR